MGAVAPLATVTLVCRSHLGNSNRLTYLPWQPQPTANEISLAIITLSTVVTFVTATLDYRTFLGNRSSWLPWFPWQSQLASVLTLTITVHGYRSSLGNTLGFRNYLGNRNS